MKEAFIGSINPPFLTEQQLAVRWQKNTMTIGRLRKRGHIPFVQIGKSPRYRLHDIERLEQSGVPCAPADPTPVNPIVHTSAR